MLQEQQYDRWYASTGWVPWTLSKKVGRWILNVGGARTGSSGWDPCHEAGSRTQLSPSRDRCLALVTRYSSDTRPSKSGGRWSGPPEFTIVSQVTFIIKFCPKTSRSGVRTEENLSEAQTVDHQGQRRHGRAPPLHHDTSTTNAHPTLRRHGPDAP